HHFVFVTLVGLLVAAAERALHAATDAKTQVSGGGDRFQQVLLGLARTHAGVAATVGVGGRKRQVDPFQAGGGGAFDAARVEGEAAEGDVAVAIRTTRNRFAKRLGVGHL